MPSNQTPPDTQSAQPADSPPRFHPVQTDRCHRRDRHHLPAAVTMRAYEVYKHVYGAQEAMVTGECRGGFGHGEVIAFLYAATFPQREWRERVEEALERP